MEISIILRKTLTDSKIGDLDLIVLATQQYILWLQIRMNHLLLMNMINGNTYLYKDLGQSLLRQINGLPNPIKVPGQVPLIAVLHDQVQPCLVNKTVNVSDYVGVPDRAHDFCLVEAIGSTGAVLADWDLLNYVRGVVGQCSALVDGAEGAFT